MMEEEYTGYLYYIHPLPAIRPFRLTRIELSKAGGETKPERAIFPGLPLDSGLGCLVGCGRAPERALPRGRWLDRTAGLTFESVEDGCFSETASSST